MTVCFNERLDGVREGTFELLGPEGVVPGEVTYEDVITFTQQQGPEFPGLPCGGLVCFVTDKLATDTVYTATVFNAMDLHDKEMAGPHTWHLDTRSTQPFFVESIGPEAGQVGVLPTATLGITFNKELLAGSEGEVSFALYKAGLALTAPVAGDVTRQGSSLRFTPAASLEPGEVYEARLVGATSYLGDRQETPHRWAFEVLDSDPPAVTHTLPDNEATGVSPYADVTIFFDKALNAGSQKVEFSLIGPDEKPVDGYLSWVSGQEDEEAELGRSTYGSGAYQGYRGLRFQALALLEPGDTYQVTVSGVESLSGVPMEEPYSWSFTVDHGAMIMDTMPPKKTLYYYFNGQRVAMRQIDEFEQVVLYWLVGDHPRFREGRLWGPPAWF